MNELRDKNGKTEAEFLAAYNPARWERPSVTVDMICYCKKSSSLLMIKRGGHPFLGKWALPGGFLEPHETAEEAAARELFEETGVKTAAFAQLRTFSAPDRDPRTRIVTIAFVAVLDELPEAEAGDDAADACWYRLDERDGKITLTGAEQLSISYTVKPSPAGRLADPDVFVTACDRIAGDHGKIIAHAVIKLKEWGVI